MNNTEVKRRPFFLPYRKPQPKKPGAPKPSPRILDGLRRGDARELEWFVAPSGASPESNLGLAVLQRAILDLITPGTPKQFKRSALDWIWGRSGSEFEMGYALSFSRITEQVTDMSPCEFRKRILSFAKEAEKSTERADAFRFQRG